MIALRPWVMITLVAILWIVLLGLIWGLLYAYGEEDRKSSANV